MAERFHSFGRVLRDLGLEREELLRLVQQGFLRAFQDRKRLVFRKSDVMAFRRLRDEGVSFEPDSDATDTDDTPPELPPDLRELGVSTDSDPASSIYESLPESAIRPRLGAILKRAQVISEAEIQEAIARQNQQRSRGELAQPIGEILVEEGYATETDVLNGLSVQNGLELLDLDKITCSRDAVRAVPLQAAEEFGVVPVRMEEYAPGHKVVVVATSDPQNFRVADSLALVLGQAVRVVVASRAQIEETRARLYAHVVPVAMEPVRTPSGRLRVNKLDESLRLVARDASQSLQRWYAEPGDTRFPPQLLGPRVFLAMPFARRFDPVADLVNRSVNELGGRALRIDQIPNLRNIWVAIEREIARADIVVADFSGDVSPDVPNPNVVTEAAIAFHKYEKPVVVITQSTKGLFFDWRHQYALTYALDREGLRRLGRGLTNRLAAEFNMFRPEAGAGVLADSPEGGAHTEPDEPV